MAEGRGLGPGFHLPSPVSHFKFPTTQAILIAIPTIEDAPMTTREVTELLTGQPASDGDGVRLLRVFGGRHPERFDPFLMLDEFGSEEARDYQGGFPPHPHRGFETVTYMLKGKMEHRDHLGNVGLLEDGGVQWMTAAKGIIHSEMPQQTSGLMHGFQLWVNLPAAAKLGPASYRDIPAGDIPRLEIPGARLTAIAGEARVNGQQVSGYFAIPTTEVLYLDARLAPGASLDIEIPPEQNAMVYGFNGRVSCGEKGVVIGAKQLARLSPGSRIRLANPDRGECGVLILAGTPLREPVVQYGPFVMNTREQIDEAIRAYQSGTLV